MTRVLAQVAQRRVCGRGQRGVCPNWGGQCSCWALRSALLVVGSPSWPSLAGLSGPS